MLTTSILITLCAALAAFAVAMWLRPLRTTDPAPLPTSASDIRDDRHPDFPHEAPDFNFSVLAAHQVMQNHRGCATNACARKAAAFETLVRAGTIKPSTR